MTDVTTVPDEVLFVEFVRRELHKRHGMFAYVTEHQKDYHALWSGVFASRSISPPPVLMGTA